MTKLLFEPPVLKKLTVSMPGKFGTRTEFEPLSHIDGLPVDGLMDTYGSPLFVLSERTIRDTIGACRQAFSTRYPKVQFAWSYKTNYLNAVCNIFHQEGSWAEVVSGFEYDKALANGVSGRHILFNGPGKSDADLVKAITNGSIIHIDSLDEFYAIADITQRTSQAAYVAVRVNLDAGVVPVWSRFGLNYENGEAWELINRIMLDKRIKLTGLHTHIGTYIMSAEPYAVAAAKLAALAVAVFKKHNHSIGYIDLGGGFMSRNTLKGAYLQGADTCISFDDYAQAISSALIKSELPPENLPTLFLETGRALIDDAGYLCSTVLSSKRLPDGRRALVIDAGVNVLYTAFWYDHKITPAQPFSQHTEDTVIYGPLCMNIDVIREHCSFPPMKRGNRVVISRTGAYTMTQWMQFIMHRPAVVLIDLEGKAHVIRRRETTETVCGQEEVPSHLASFRDAAAGRKKSVHNSYPRLKSSALPGHDFERTMVIPAIEYD